MQIIWSPLSLTDMETIKRYYSQFSDRNITYKQILKIHKSVELIKTQPCIWHQSENDDEVLEWVVPSTYYTIPYMIELDEIFILRVFDQRQEKPQSWI